MSTLISLLRRISSILHSDSDFSANDPKEAWVFNLQAPEHLKLCWWWCQQEWQPWNRFFSKVVGCKICLKSSLPKRVAFFLNTHTLSHTFATQVITSTIHIRLLCVYTYELMHVWVFNVSRCFYLFKTTQDLRFKTSRFPFYHPNCLSPWAHDRDRFTN